MPTYRRYLSFAAGELEAALRQLDDTPGRASALALALTTRQNGSRETANTGGRTRLLKSHSCSVVFPDRIGGRCRYTRGGPSWHVFQFEHGGDGTAFTAVSLPPLYWMRPLGNDIVSIEAKARELADEAYLKAALREQKEHFGRASESPTRRKHPNRYRMTAKRAKEIGGRYALCYRTGSGEGLIPIAPTCAHLVDANTAWLQKRDLRTVVACCNRLDRCWQLPRFNPLYAEFDPRPEVQQEVTPELTHEAAPAAPCASSVTTASATSTAEDDWDYLPVPDGEDDDGHDDHDEEEAP